MSFPRSKENAGDDAQTQKILREAFEHSVKVSRAWQLFLHLSLEYLRIPLAVRCIVFRPEGEDTPPDADYPNKEIEERLSDAFEFETTFHTIDSRIQVVDDLSDVKGGPAIMWEDFGAQRAFHARIQAAMNDGDLDNVHMCTQEAELELRPVQRELQELADSIEVLRKVQREWTGNTLPTEPDTHLTEFNEEDYRREMIQHWTKVSFLQYGIHPTFSNTKANCTQQLCMLWLGLRWRRYDSKIQPWCHICGAQDILHLRRGCCCFRRKSSRRRSGLGSRAKHSSENFMATVPTSLMRETIYRLLCRRLH